MKFLLILILIPFIYSLNNTYIGNNNGNWFNDTNWSLNRTPVITDNVFITNNSVIAKSHITLFSKNISLVNSSLDIQTYGCSNIVIGDKSTVNFNNSVFKGDIYNYGIINLNNKCNHSGDIYNYNSYMILLYSSSLNINGTIFNEAVNISFNSINRQHYNKISNIHANRIIGGNTTLFVAKNQLTHDNEKFCWTILSGNYIVGKYNFNNEEYRNSSIIKQYVYVWVCFEDYH